MLAAPVRDADGDHEVAEPARPERESRQNSTRRSEVGARHSPAPAGPAGPAGLLLSLQRSAGNGAVVRYLQRIGETDVEDPHAPAPAPPAPADGARPVPQAQDSEVPPGLERSRLRELDELLDHWNVDEDAVIDLMSYMGPSDRNAVMARYRDQLVDCLNGSEMIRAMRNLHAPLGPALDWIDAAATITRLIDYDEIRELVTRASQPERDAIANDHYRTFFVKVCTNATMITALVDLNFPWATARRWAREEGTNTLDLARGLDRGGRLSIPGLTAFLDAARDGWSAAREHLRNLPDEDLTALRGGNPVPADVIRDTFGGHASDVMRVLHGEISSGEAETSTSETLLAGPTTSPFVAMDFGGDRRFTIAYRRDRVDVSVGVELEAVDDRAETLLAAAKTIWLDRIRRAWGNRFRLTNGDRTIPLRFHINLDSGSNHVNVHSGVWAWPNLNAGNWFAPDHEQVPQQEEAVSQAPVHEFGHLIGNADEYNRTAEHYVQVTGEAVTSPNAVPETDTAGTTRYTNSLSLMGSGTQVEPRHANSIVDWVNRNLRSGEPAFSVVA
jgi:hypothetical protein